MKTKPGDARVVFIGAGNMAEALVKGLIHNGICAASRITVTDVRPERTNYFRAAFGVAFEEKNTDAVRAAEIVVLAVKPQAMAAVLAELAPALPAAALVISIAAGIPTGRIEGALGGSRAVIRVMPNTPALVGAGVSALCAGRHATAEHLDLAERLLGAVGIVVRVEEKDMDAVTAVSGSGPAYVFYLLEAVLAAASRLGLDEETARTLAYSTVEGAARLIRETGEPAATLRERVTSKGGTTAAALEVLNRRGVSDSLIEAIQAAAKRSRELSGM